MATPAGYRAYGQTSADQTVTVDGGVLKPGPSGTIQIYPSQTATDPIADILDAAGSPISAVPVSTAGLVTRFYVPNTIDEVWTPGPGGRVQLPPIGGGGGSSSAATVDTLGQAGTTGKAVMKAGTQAAARDAIGAGTVNSSDLPGEISAAAVSDPASTAVGLISGRRFKAAFDALLGTALASYGFVIERNWIVADKVWEPLNLPSWYTKPVRWISPSDSTATSPPEKRVQDRWLRRKAAA